MADDPYQRLGIPKTATAEEIRAAYRKLAKQHHPDLNPGNKSAEETFKKIAAANALLSDPEKRAQYDRGEIDADGAQKEPPRSYRHYAEEPAGARYTQAGFTGGNFEDLFASMFEARSNAPARGADRHYTLQATFLDAINGATTRLALPDGQTLDIKIPPGTSEGDILRLRGRGEPGRNGAPPGDALIEISISPHKLFRREGQNIHLTLPITLKEAVLGGKITIPTPAGPVALTLKPNTSLTAELRLRGRGVPAHGTTHAGDLYVKPVVELGPTDETLAAFLQNWNQPNFNPRSHLEDSQ